MQPEEIEIIAFEWDIDSENFNERSFGDILDKNLFSLACTLKY